MVNNIQLLKSNRGFTLVELLIVIVVIAILAAITIVAYNGVQNRAKTSAGQSLANIIAKKAQAYQTLNSSYPTWCQLTTNKTDTSQTGGTCGATGTISAGDEAKLDQPSSVIYASAAAGTGYSTSNNNSNKVVGYYFCSTSLGANIFYIDYTNSNAVTSAKVGTGC